MCTDPKCTMSFRSLDSDHQVIPPEKKSKIVSLENAEDLAKVVSAAKIDLFRSIRSHSGSITDISKRLNRDCSAVKRDIDVLQSIGLVDIRTMKNAGHGTKKEVIASDSQVFMAW